MASTLPVFNSTLSLVPNKSPILDSIQSFTVNGVSLYRNNPLTMVDVFFVLFLVLTGLVIVHGIFQMYEEYERRGYLNRRRTDQRKRARLMKRGSVITYIIESDGFDDERYQSEEVGRLTSRRLFFEMMPEYMTGQYFGVNRWGEVLGPCETSDQLDSLINQSGSWSRLGYHAGRA